MQALRAVKEILDAFTTSGVHYIHWKSNEHLEAALLGLTDLDILIPADTVEVAHHILDQRDCRCVHSNKSRSYPEREDWLGFDNFTGEQFHLDLHTAITIGGRIVKNYALPIATWLLQGTTQVDGVSIPSPNRELALLILRTVTKTPRITRHRRRGIPSELRKELDWLLARYDESSFEDDVSAMGLPIDPVFFTTFVTDYSEGRLLRSLLLSKQRSLRRLLCNFRAKSRIRVGWMILGHILRRHVLGRLVKRRKKIHSQPALFAAIVGADGAGKSTVVRDLVKWLGWKLEARTLYFGMPRRHLPVKALGKLRAAGASASRALQRVPILRGVARYFAGILDAYYWLSIARVRLNTYRRALRLRKQGTIVIAERYPLREFWTMERPMDGPRIPTDRRGLKRLSRIERSRYERIGRVDPLFIIDVPAEVLETRKTDSAIPEKSEIIHAVAQANNDGAIVIDGAVPYPEVLLAIKRELWKRL